MSQQLDRIETLIAEHIERTNAQHLVMSNQLTRLETKGEAEKERMDKHERDIEKLKVWKNLNIAGILASMGAWFK